MLIYFRIQSTHYFLLPPDLHPNTFICAATADHDCHQTCSICRPEAGHHLASTSPEEDTRRHFRPKQARTAYRDSKQVCPASRFVVYCTKARVSSTTLWMTGLAGAGLAACYFIFLAKPEAVGSEATGNPEKATDPKMARER